MRKLSFRKCFVLPAQGEGLDWRAHPFHFTITRERIFIPLGTSSVSSAVVNMFVHGNTFVCCGRWPFLQHLLCPVRRRCGWSWSRFLLFVCVILFLAAAPHFLSPSVNEKETSCLWDHVCQTDVRVQMFISGHATFFCLHLILRL